MLNEWVTPLALPPAGQETETGTTCTLSGWGNLHVSCEEHFRLNLSNINYQENDYSNPNKLHKVDIPIVSDEDCARFFILDSLSHITISPTLKCLSRQQPLPGLNDLRGGFAR